MVTELKPATLTRQHVADLVAAYIKGGKVPWTAADQVITDLRNIGQAEALLDVLGPDAVLRIWRELDRRQREQAPKPSRPEPEPFIRPGAPPQRRVELEALKSDASLLEGMYQIRGTWRRIGDLDKNGCRMAAQWFKEQAIEQVHTSRYFHALAQALNGGETVRQRFDDDGLMRLWDVAKRGS